MSSVCGYCLCKDGHMGPCPHQEIERLRAENASLRTALKPILARLEMPANRRSQTLSVTVHVSELVELRDALAGKEQENA